MFFEHVEMLMVLVVLAWLLNMSRSKKVT